MENKVINVLKVLTICWLHLVVTVNRFCDAKYVEGELKTPEKWAFLDRFCFLSEKGAFQFEIEYELDYAVLSLLLYYDTSDQWPSVYPSDKSCDQRIAVMSPEKHQIINLTEASFNSHCEVMREFGGNPRYVCKGRSYFTSARERWWFIAISNCESTEGLKLKYKLTMTNGYRYWNKHFSADEFYILRTDLVAFILQLGLFFLSLMASAELKKRQLFHSTYKMYMVSLAFQVIGIGFLIMHYSKYGLNGVGSPSAKLFGRVLTSISSLIMMLLLLLIAKGYTITRGRLRQNSAIKLTVFMCLYTVVTAFLFIFEQKFFDPGQVLYLYESPPGYGLIVLRCIGWLMLLYATFFTLKHYPEKASFYYPFFMFYTLWFLSGPIVIIISNHIIDKWVREKVVNGVELGITLLGHSFFLFLTRPNVANKNFPFHVRTTQISVMENSINGYGPGGNLDAFNTHAYAPDFPNATKAFTNTDMFLVSGAVEMRPIRPPSSILKQDLSFPHHSELPMREIFTQENQHHKAREASPR